MCICMFRMFRTRFTFFFAADTMSGNFNQLKWIFTGNFHPKIFNTKLLSIRVMCDEKNI